jgi:MerR family transcriptional regulator/heat shock protein HspR
MSDSSDRRKGTYMISAVAELYEIHPQTLRMYEREGLLQPSRSGGNTRQYTDSDLRRLEVILSLTRDLGVNLAGVEVIMNMRSNMERLQREVADLMCFVRDELMAEGTAVPDQVVRALVRLERGALVPSRRPEETE